MNEQLKDGQRQNLLRHGGTDGEIDFTDDINNDDMVLNSNNGDDCGNHESTDSSSDQTSDGIVDDEDDMDMLCENLGDNSDDNLEVISGSEDSDKEEVDANDDFRNKLRQWTIDSDIPLCHINSNKK